MGPGEELAQQLASSQKRGPLHTQPEAWPSGSAACRKTKCRFQLKKKRKKVEP